MTFKALRFCKLTSGLVSALIIEVLADQFGPRLLKIAKEWLAPSHQEAIVSNQEPAPAPTAQPEQEQPSAPVQQNTSTVTEAPVATPPAAAPVLSQPLPPVPPQPSVQPSNASAGKRQSRTYDF